MSIFSERLSNLIKQKGVSRAQLAYALGITPASISRYLSGTQSPSLEILCNIAEYFNVPVDYLLSDNVQNYQQTIEPFMKSADEINNTLINKDFQISQRDYLKLSLDKVVSDFSNKEFDELLAYAYYIVYQRKQSKE